MRASAPATTMPVHESTTSQGYNEVELDRCME
jgi:hypothetical protein